MALSQKQIIDCKGMQCPAPILHIAKAARQLGKQPAVFEVLVDDGDFPNDLEAWCRTSKNQLVELAESDGIYRATIALNGAIPGNDTTFQSGTQPAVVQTRPATPLPAPSRSATLTADDTTRLDCRGMQCPAPILALSKSARSFGKQPMLIEVLSDDAEFPRDLEAWCRTTHSQVCESSEQDGTHRVLVAINGAADPLTITEVEEEMDAPQQAAAAPLPAAPAPSPLRQVAAAPPPQSAGTAAVAQAAQLDLRGLRAPEPVRQLSRALVTTPGSRVRVLSDDPGFMSDVMAWSRAAGVSVLSAQHQPEATLVELQLGDASAPALSPTPASLPVPLTVPAQQLASPAEGPLAVPRDNLCTILIIHNDFESLMAAMMCATTAAAQGMDAAIYFSFWGVNLLRGERPRRDVPKGKVSILQKLMQWMMPKGPRRQKMGKMHMGGMGLGMMNYFMRKNNVMSLAELMDSAVEQEVKFVVCSMSMGIMGIQKRDIMDLPNIEFAGVTAFVEMSRRSSMSLVF